MFLVMVVNTEMEVTVANMTPEMTSKVGLQYAEGMVGAMPVFATEEQAEAYAGDEYQVIPVAAR